MSVSAFAAGDTAATWQTVAQRAAFAVYRPTQTLGLVFDGVKLVPQTGCLTASWGNPRSGRGPHFNLGEPGDSPQCGQPGVATEVSTTIINDVKVPVLVQCPTWPRCAIKNGSTNGFFLLFVPKHVSGRYGIQLESRHISLAHFLEIAKSFTRVKTGPHGAALHLANFVSPDRKTWCALGPGAMVCYSGGPPSAAISKEYSATLHANGQLATCAWKAGQNPYTVCYQNWDAEPVLRSGQVDVLSQFRCQAASAAITCTVDTGTGKGKGFTISDTGVTPIP
jgi:hypothetical protein